MHWCRDRATSAVQEPQHYSVEVITDKPLASSPSQDITTNSLSEELPTIRPESYFKCDTRLLFTNS